MKKMMILFSLVTVFACVEEQKKEQIRLEDYNRPIRETKVEKTENQNTNKESQQAVQVEKAGIIEITLKATDKMTFSKDEISVPSGSTIKLTLTHTGKLPANVMGHNFVLLKKGTDVAAFALKAGDFAKNDYIPKETDKVIAHTKIIGGGESVTIEFKAPKPGTYTFICSFPGHYINMQGRFVVE